MAMFVIEGGKKLKGDIIHKVLKMRLCRSYQHVFSQIKR